MTKPERPPTVWGKLEWRGESGQTALLRTNITKRYADHAIADYATTYGNRHGAYIFVPYTAGEKA